MSILSGPLATLILSRSADRVGFQTLKVLMGVRAGWSTVALLHRTALGSRDFWFSQAGDHQT